MSFQSLPVTSHDPPMRARPTVGPDDVLYRCSHRKHLGSLTALGPQSMSHVPCVCRVLYHRGPQVCDEHVWGEL
jgi:hypothetical protein